MTAHKTTAKTLASATPSLLFNHCTRCTQFLKRCVLMIQQTTTHTYQFWKFREAPSSAFQAGISDTGAHVWPTACEADISTTRQSSHTHAARGVPGPAAAICLGCLETWEPSQCCNPSQGTAHPASPDKWPKHSKAAHDTKAGESAAMPARKAACSPS